MTRFLIIGIAVSLMAISIMVLNTYLQNVEAQTYTVASLGGNATLLDVVGTTLPKPNISFPNEQALYDYYLSMGTLNQNNQIKNITGNITGPVKEIEISSFANNTYVAWIESKPGDNSTDVYISVSRNGGLNYTQPLALNDQTISSTQEDLGLKSNGNMASLVWEQLNNQTTVGNVYASTTLDKGFNFKTWQLNINGTGAKDPRVSETGEFTWVYVLVVDPLPGGGCPEGYVYDPIEDKCFKEGVLTHRGW